MRSAEPLVAAVGFALVALAFLKWDDNLQLLFALHPWIAPAPAILALLLLAGWGLVRWLDAVRFGEDAWMLRRLSVRVPRALREFGIVAPAQVVGGKSRPGEPFKVHLVTRRFRSQRVKGLSVKVPLGLRRNILTADLLTEVLGIYERRGKSFILYADARGDRGRWLFFQVLVIEVGDVEPATDVRGTEEERH